MIIPSFKAGILSFIKKVVQSIPLGTKGSLYVFGESLDGSLGLSDNISRSIPVQLVTDTNCSKLSGGRNFFLAINSD